MNRILFLLFIIFQSCKSQTKVEAKINIDNHGNISISQVVNIPMDTVLINLKSKVDTSKLSFIKKVKTPKGFHNKYLIKTNSSSIEYEYLKPKRNKKNHFITDSVFYFSKNYLAYNDLMDNKLLDLKFQLPKDFILINPSKKSLKKTLTSPDIIAGIFNKEIINGFEVFSLQNENSENKKSILNIVDKCFNFYSSILDNSLNKPRIIFMPLIGLKGRKIYNNTILLDDSILKIPDFDIRVIAHEMAHLWLNKEKNLFKDRILSESFSEFLAIQFLKSINKENIVKKLLAEKNYKCEIYNSFSLLYKDGKTLEERNDLSYNFIPILLNHIYEYDKSFFKEFAFLYKNRDSTITNREFENFIAIFGYKDFFEKTNLLPDYYISKSNDSIHINSTENITWKVPVKYVYDNSFKIDSLDFSKSKKIRVDNDNTDLKKIIIDPNYVTLQNSRINDIWDKENHTYFNKNNYQSIIKSNENVNKIVHQIISYLTDKYKIEELNIDKSKIEWVITKLKIIKNDIYNNDSVLDSASVNFVKEKNNRIEIKLIFYNENYKNSHIISFKAYTNDNLNLITHITY
ncbi:hypothetical protein [Gaetbulibacter jejuensis]|uniref:hypothetical protein n=1 Tax=Gaetbulibacter jejuensis TaxID=584607 RepID=UPI00300A120C